MAAVIFPACRSALDVAIVHVVGLRAEKEMFGFMQGGLSQV